VHLAVLVAAGVCTLPATVLAQRSPSFVTPTTTTATTVAPVVVNPTTTTVAPVVVTPTTTTVAPVVVNPTTTTVAPVVVTPTTTAPPLIVTPTTPIGLDDLVQATVAPDGDGSGVSLGAIDTSGAVPEGLDVTAFPGAPEAPTPAADGPTLTAGLSCAYQCIKSGVAYARGFGALLVVETHVPARLFITVVDADNDLVDATNLAGVQTGFLWALDHLEPGQTYYAMVVATDENDDSSYAYGQFTTLSERTVHVTIGDVTIDGGPQYNHGVYFDLEVDGEFSTSFTPTLADVDRQLDLRLWVRLYYDGNLCEYLPGPDDGWGPQGYSEDHCVVWNSALLDNIDLDAIPGAGQGTWTDTTVQETFTTGSSGGALPDAGVFFIHFSAPLTLYVTYS
jgi:hypothetical protein